MQRGEESAHVAVNVLSGDEEGTITTTGSPSSSQELSDVVSGADKEISNLLPGQGVLPPDSEPAARRIPWFAWPLLLASLASVSSAGVIFASLPEVPTFTLAAWRLQTTGFLLVPGAIYQYVNIPSGAFNAILLQCSCVRHLRSAHAHLVDCFLSAGDRQRFHRNLLLILASGAFLAIHFSFWIMVG